jgi:hypothetical protein
MKKTFLLLIGILMVSLVIAGGIIELNTQKTLSKEKLDLIKAETKLGNVEVRISDTECFNQVCNIKVTGFINKEYEINYIKCTNYDYKNHQCLEQRKKNETEIRAEIDNFVLNDIDNYAEELIKEKKSTGGILEIK